MSTVYIAGPMTGLPEYNYPAFHLMAARLRGLGYSVLSPAEHDLGTDKPRELYMRRGLELLMKSDMVVLLDGWSASKGAVLEVDVAKALGLKIYDQRITQSLDRG